MQPTDGGKPREIEVTTDPASMLVAMEAHAESPRQAVVGSAEWPRPAGPRADDVILEGSPGAATTAVAALVAPALRIERRPTAVLLADVAGYSQLIELDDLDTALRLRCLYRQIVAPMALAHRGRIVDLAGDGCLMAFPTADDAVLCAVEVQHRLGELERGTPPNRCLSLRMGVSADDALLIIDGNLYGRAVNVAARLLALAAPGQIYLSEEVFNRINGPIALCCEPLGRLRLRNFSERVRAYRICCAERWLTSGALANPSSEGDRSHQVVPVGF